MSLWHLNLGMYSNLGLPHSTQQLNYKTIWAGSQKSFKSTRTLRPFF